MPLIGPETVPFRMPSPAVVKALNVLDDVAFGPRLGGADRAVQPLVFQGREESFARAIVPADPGAAHG